MKKAKMYNIIYRLKKRGVAIETRKRIILYGYDNLESTNKMNSKAVKRLCAEFGFARQATIVSDAN